MPVHQNCFYMATQKITPVKTDLFRFVSLRTPQLINRDRKKYRFITHPDLSKSFFTCELDAENLSAAREAVQLAAKSFKPVYHTLQDIKDAFGVFYDLSSWLIHNRNTITDDLANERLKEAEKPGLEKLLSLWDHLFYQTITRNNPTVRQACIQLIITSHFVHLYKETDYDKTAILLITTPRKPASPLDKERVDIFLQRIAQARVLIPKCFSVGREKTDGKDSGKDKKKKSTRDLNKKHAKFKTGYRVEKYSRIKSELRSAMTMVKDGSKLAPLLENSTKGAKNLSADTRSFLEKNAEKDTTLVMAERLLDAHISEERRRSSFTVSSFRKSKKKEAIPLYSYALSVDQEELLLTLNTGYSGAYITSAKQQLTYGANTINSDAVTEIGTDNDGLLMLKLIADKELSDNNEKQFGFSGSFTLSNGHTIEVETTGSPNSPVTNGTGILQVSSSFTGPTPPSMGVLYGVHRLGIGVYRKVEQEVCCYVPGEVSRIENIMAREYKERQTRSLISTETTEEDTTEIEVENQSDTVSTNRNELQSEIAKQLSKDTSISAGASLGVSGSYAGVTVSADGSFDFASSTSSTSSDSAAQTYAQEVTNTALERVLQKTTQKRTSKILEEYEENNRHGYDNREGTQHVTGVYRWIDIIYKNRLINYGKRLMIEFLIPEPAKFYKQALKAQAEAAADTGVESELEAPTSLSDLGIDSASDITEDNYLELGRAYGITLDEPVTPSTKTITKSLTPTSDPDAKESTYSYAVNFNETGDLSMYSAYEASVSFSFDYHMSDFWEPNTYFKLKVYEETIKYDKDNLTESEGNSEAKSSTKTGSKTFDLPDIKSSLSASVNCKNVYDFSVNLTVKLKLDDSETAAWQNSVYDALMQAYDDQLAAYEEAVEEEEAAVAAEEEDQEDSNSSDFNRTVEQRELQRIAIEMMVKPFSRTQGKDFYYTGSCDVPQVKQTLAWEAYSSQVKFFEQAFDWSLMAYIFYPYYWAGKCSWIELLQTKDADDPIFQSFLQSGMARVVIPVRPGFEEAMDYYMETGDIWNGGGLVMDTDDDLYVSIDEELMEIEGFVDKEWETRVPTTLTIIQGSSVYLEDEGLPCCHEVESGEEDTLLRGSDVILGDSDDDTETGETLDTTDTE